MMAASVNRLRELIASGAISEDDLNSMFISGQAGGGMSNSAPPQNALVKAMNPQEAFAASDQSGPLPMGSMRNEATGRVTYFQPDASAPRTQADPGFSYSPYPSRPQRQVSQTRVIGYGDGGVTDLGMEPSRAEPIDYTRPAVDIPGVGRGFYTRDGRSAFVSNPDGSKTKVVLGYDAAASDARNLRALKMDELRLGMERDRVGIEQAQQKTEAIRQAQELAAQQAMMPPAPKPTAGQDAVDKEFGKEYVEFKAAGGYADTVKQLGQLREVSDALASGKSLTGAWIGNAPDAVLAVTNPEALAARDAVEEVVQRNLRLILGAQFTQKEGERLIARAYNPRLGEAENKKRVDRLILQMETAAKAKQDAIDHYEANGSLRGWGGKLFTKSDFSPDSMFPEGKPTFGAAKPMPTSKANLVAGEVYRTPRGLARWNGTAFETQ